MLRSAYGKGLGCYMVMLTALIKRSVKFVLLILISGSLLAFMPAGESQVVSLSFKEAPLQKVFAEIRKQTGYSFAYFETDLAKAKRVNINISNTRVQDALNVIFQDQPLTYTIIEKVVVVKQKSAEKKINQEQSSPQALQPIDVQGRVLNEQGDPVAGVTVQVKGDNRRGTYTDSEGEFELKKVDPQATLILTAVNIERVETVINGRNNLDLRVKGKTGKLDEVQVIAYGKSSQRFSLGPVTTVKAEEIERQPVNNPLLALQGRVPGLVVSQANGVPGGGITIRIQGRNNLDNTFVGSDPFIVIDGIPYPSQNLATFKGGGEVPILGSSSDDGALSFQKNYGNPLAFINPADIESITVLKDADATAIYGSRAANGAILITTKKGKPGIMKTDINLQQGWGQVPKKMDLLNSRQYMEMRWEAKRNDGRAVNATDYDLRGVWDTTRYTDWQDELIGGTAKFTRVTAGVSGGTNNFQYLVSSTYGRETSVFPGDFANTFGALHFNISASSINQRFKMQLGGSYMANTNKLPAEDYTSHALNLPPLAPPLYDGDGSLSWAPDPITSNSTWFNPLSRQYNLFEIKTNNLVSNGSLSYRIVPCLELKSTFGFTSTTSDQFIAALDESEKPEVRESRLRTATFSYNTSRSWIVEPQLVFQQKWENYSLGVLIGATFQYQNNNGRGFTAYGQTNDLLLRDMLAGTSLDPNGVDVNEYKYNAIFGRINYTWQDKYLVNLTARRDGSSRFGPNNRFSNFGAVGLGWIISEESFFKRSLPLVSFAKIRGSYGTTGNDQIGNYQFLNLYQSFYPGISYQGIGSSIPQGLPNPNLEWEETRKLQAGIDLGFWRDRLLLTVNYFRNRTSNSLTTVNMPISTGFNLLVTNLPALIQNTGWEFTLSSTNIKLRGIRWSSNVNLTIPSNKLLAFPGLESSPLVSFMTIGLPLNTLKAYPFYGVDPLTGLYMVANRHGEPTSNPDVTDLTVILNTSPRWYGGFQNSISYKGFSIDFVLQFTRQYASDVRRLANSPGYFSSELSSSIFGNQPVWVMDRWQKPGDISKYQRFSTTGGLGTSIGNVAYKDLSFVRMKNLSVSYQLAASLLQKIKLQQLRVYANAQNMFTITRYKGLDPETRSISSLPPLRIITIGIQATL